MSFHARNSRWDRLPKLDKLGRPVIARLADGDIAILTILSRFRYLPTDYIATLTGRSLSAIQARLEVLYRSPNRFVSRPHQQRGNAAANCRRLVYELDDAGITQLHQRGIPYSLKRKNARNFFHELTTCLIAASFEIGSDADPRIRIIGWHQLINSPQMPAATKQLANPHLIPCTLGTAPQLIASDWRPFVIERKLDTTSYVFVAGFEADSGTEPIDTTDPDRSAIRNKFLAYLNCLEQDVPRQHFGATTFMIPFVTTTERRMRSMIELLAKLQPGPYGKRFLFKHIPSFTSLDKPTPATGHILTEPWQRAGFEPFSFLP